MTVPSALEISRRVTLKPPQEVAASMGIGRHLLEPYGDAVAKIKLAAIDELADRPPGKYVVVTAVTPTPLGEGKTTTTIGLGQAFAHVGRRGVVAIRQASMGPTFGIKGGATSTTTTTSSTSTATASPGGGCWTSTTACCATSSSGWASARTASSARAASTSPPPPR